MKTDLTNLLEYNKEKVPIQTKQLDPICGLVLDPSNEQCRACFKRVDKMQPKCPFCQKWFDQPIGNQPENGTKYYQNRYC